MVDNRRGMTDAFKDIEKFEAAEPLNEQRRNFHRQNGRLRAAHDLLLPRLRSGEVVVGNLVVR
jgi:hypothetical protein